MQLTVGDVHTQLGQAWSYGKISGWSMISVTYRKTVSSAMWINHPKFLKITGKAIDWQNFASLLVWRDVEVKMGGT